MIGQFGLTEETMSKMLSKSVGNNPNSEVYWSEILRHLIPNIVEVISANNEAILFNLETERTREDSGK